MMITSAVNFAKDHGNPYTVTSLITAVGAVRGGEKRGFQTPGRTLVAVLSGRVNGHLRRRITVEISRKLTILRIEGMCSRGRGSEFSAQGSGFSVQGREALCLELEIEDHKQLGASKTLKA